MMAQPVLAVTFNTLELARMLHWRRMFDGFLRAGAIPIAVDCGDASLRIAQLLDHVDGLVISGGGDIDPVLYGGDRHDPEVRGVNGVRDSNEIAAFESAWCRGIPTLAICRGAQLVNAVRGGTLYADLVRDRPSGISHRHGEHHLLSTAHRVEVTPGTRLADWLGTDGPIPVNSQHHQGIRDLAPGLVATARAEDGLIEAYEASEQAVTGVQWHPEIDWEVNEMSRRVLDGFIAECGGGSLSPPADPALEDRIGLVVGP